MRSRTLGWTESSWQDSDSTPLSASWASLNTRQQAAAHLLGYEEADFDEDIAGQDNADAPDVQGSNPRPARL